MTGSVIIPENSFSKTVHKQASVERAQASPQARHPQAANPLEHAGLASDQKGRAQEDLKWLDFWLDAWWRTEVEGEKHGHSRVGVTVRILSPPAPPAPCRVYRTLPLSVTVLSAASPNCFALPFHDQ